MAKLNGKAETSQSTFRRETRVGISIKATPEKVWGLLTNAVDFPKWNSTVKGIEGNIALGEKIALRTTADEKRVFNLKIVEMQKPYKMVWSDGMAPFFKGVRTFEITPEESGCYFSMVEVLSGLMYPMAAKHIPDFKPVFESYAADLKKAAEKGNS